MSEQLSSKENNDDSPAQNHYLTFWMDNQLFAVPIIQVVQIIGMQEILEIPDCPAFAKGVIHLRESIVPVLDFRMCLGKPEAAYNKHSYIIIVNVHKSLYGVAVDHMNEVMEILPEYISPPPPTGDAAVNKCLSGAARLDEKLIMMLDCTKLLDDEEFKKLSACAGSMAPAEN